jgi:uncharacterized protein YndB with AHSA1/START domain
MRVLGFVAAFLVVLAQAPAGAGVVSSSPSAITLHAEAEVAASPADAWRALTRIERWWNGAHTYSGEARRLSLDPRAGGCFCERWEGQSVEHARVVMVFEHEGVRTLRLQGALGPLQEMGAFGTLTFTVAPHASGAKLTMTYRVTGDPSLGLDALASPVDGVLNEQFSRLVAFAGGERTN